MPLLIGIGVAIAVVIFGRVSGFDRDRAFYATVLIVVASYYLLFAAMGGTVDDLLLELIPFALFAAVAIIGFRTNMWILAMGLAAHGIFDFSRNAVLAGSGIPPWWPAFCAGFDIAAGAALAGLMLARGKLSRT